MKAAGVPITVAVAGLGRAGWLLHLQPIVAHPGFKVVAVADPLAERRQEAATLTGCRQFASIDELLRDVESDVVVVATPTFTHYSDAVKVLEAGRHCVLEKPMAMSFAEAGRLLDLARSRNRRLFVHHSYLHLAPYHHLRKVISSNVLGPLFHLRAFWGAYRRRWDWQTLKKNGGGLLNNHGTHALSIVLPLLGSPVVRALAEYQNVKDAGDADDHVHMVLQTGGNVSADIVISTAVAQNCPKWMLCGKSGTLVLEGTIGTDAEVSRLRYFDATKVPALELLDAAAPGRVYGSEELPWEEKELAVEPPPVKPFYGNVHDVLVNGAEPVVTPESAVEVMRVIELARQSA